MKRKLNTMHTINKAVFGPVCDSFQPLASRRVFSALRAENYVGCVSPNMLEFVVVRL